MATVDAIARPPSATAAQAIACLRVTMWAAASALSRLLLMDVRFNVFPSVGVDSGDERRMGLLVSSEARVVLRDAPRVFYLFDITWPALVEGE